MRDLSDSKVIISIPIDEIAPNPYQPEKNSMDHPWRIWLPQLRNMVYFNLLMSEK